MTITYSLAPNPKWYIADLVGKPLGGGYLATYRSLDKTEIKVVFEDPAGNFPWPYVTIPNTGLQGILFDENGAQGPFYFETDSNNLNDTYFLEVYDANGNLQWTVDDFSPPGGGGGGGDVTEGIDLKNLLLNNVFYRNIGATPNPIAKTVTLLAPGAHSGLALTASNAGPDISFIKNNTNATDQIQFLNFTLGSEPLTGDTTPVQYLNYACTNTPSGETQKCVQFPIVAQVQNLSNSTVTITIWARGNSGTTTLTLNWMSFFGDGAGASLTEVTPIQTLSLTNTWQQYTITTTVPDVSGKVLGGCGNSGLFFQVQYPLGVSCNIDFIKPFICLGNIVPTQSFDTYDEIDAQTNSPRTGDIRTTINNYMFGYVPMNDGTIGSASSGATTRANIDTFPLYNHIWNSVSNAWAPVSGGRGSTAVADFVANKTINLTRALGRVFAGTLNTEITQSFTTNHAASNTNLIVSSSAGFFTGVPIVLTGGSLPTGLNANQTYYAIQVDTTHIALASSITNALANTAITFSADGSGTIQVTPYALGQYVGEETHILTINEMPSHNHPGSTVGNSATGATATTLGFGQPSNISTSPVSVAFQGAGAAHNILQPTTYMNVFIKL